MNVTVSHATRDASLVVDIGRRKGSSTEAYEAVKIVLTITHHTDQQTLDTCMDIYMYIIGIMRTDDRWVRSQRARYVNEQFYYLMHFIASPGNSLPVELEELSAINERYVGLNIGIVLYNILTISVAPCATRVYSGTSCSR